MDVTVNEPEHSHYLLNNKITVSDAEELESFLVSPICSVIYRTFFARLLVITRHAKQARSSMLLVVFTEGVQGLCVHILWGILHNASIPYIFVVYIIHFVE